MDKSKRNLAKILGATGISAVVWKKPVVNSVSLPSHAAATCSSTAVIPGKTSTCSDPFNSTLYEYTLSLDSNNCLTISENIRIDPDLPLSGGEVGELWILVRRLDDDLGRIDVNVITESRAYAIHQNCNELRSNETSDVQVHPMTINGSAYTATFQVAIDETSARTTDITIAPAV